MITEWIETQNFQFKRINERPWGGYELAISTDGGTSWSHFPRPFGSRIDEKSATEQLLTEAVLSDILRPQLIAWLGEERTSQIQRILGIDDATTENLSEVSSDKTD